jgi:anti-sigma-K factor RskA
MSHTTDLLERLKKLKNIESDYRTAKILGITHGTISNYRSGVSHADDRVAVLLADELGLDRFTTIARINAERAKKPEERAFWKRVATAAAFVMAVYTSISPSAANSQTLHSERDASPLCALHKSDTVCIAHYLDGTKWHSAAAPTALDRRHPALYS